MKSRALPHVLIISTLVLTASASAKPLVAFSPTKDGIDVLVDGKVLTRYIHRIDPAEPMAAKGVLLTKPVLFPLRTPSGITVRFGQAQTLSMAMYLSIYSLLCQAASVPVSYTHLTLPTN